MVSCFSMPHRSRRRLYSFSEVDGLELTAASSSFSWRGHRIAVPIGGRHNVSNALAAATAAGALGIPIPTIAAGIGNAGPVPGRFEPIEEGQRFSVVVDYAHTPDGLQRVLAAAREVAARQPGDRRVRLRRRPRSHQAAGDGRRGR